MPISASSSLNIDLVRILRKTRARAEYACSSRDSDALIYYIKGSQTFFFPDRTFTATEGEVVYLPYMSKYKNKVNQSDTEYYELDFIVYNDGVGKPLFDSPMHVKKPDSLGYRDLISKIRYSHHASPERSHYACFAHLCTLIDMISAQENIKNSYLLSRIKPSLDYIDQNYQLSTSIPDIAAESSMCATSLERIFKLCLRTSPNAYRNMVRIDKAKQFLLSGLGIVEVAELVGFYDSCHFSKTFKRIVGVSPGEYAKAGRQN